VVPFKNSPFDGYPLALILHKSTSDETPVHEKSAGTRVTARLNDDLLQIEMAPQTKQASG
jgi:hypothetical protein